MAQLVCQQGGVEALRTDVHVQAVRSDGREPCIGLVDDKGEAVEQREVNIKGTCDDGLDLSSCLEHEIVPLLAGEG